MAVSELRRDFNTLTLPNRFVTEAAWEENPGSQLGLVSAPSLTWMPARRQLRDGGCAGSIDDWSRPKIGEVSTGTEFGPKSVCGIEPCAPLFAAGSQPFDCDQPVPRAEKRNIKVHTRFLGPTAITFRFRNGATADAEDQ